MTQPVRLTDAPEVGAYAPPDAPPTITCANCGWTPCDNYCPRCGQETHDLHRSLAGILNEMLDTFAGWDGKIPRTFWLFVRHPGALTREFLDGRRVRSLRPLRIFITMSVLFFLTLNTFASRPNPLRALQPKPGAKAIVRNDGNGIKFDTNALRLIDKHRNDRDTGPTAWFKHHFIGGLARVKDLPPEQGGRLMRDAFISHVPNMVFVLLPVFALVLRLFYLRTPVYYAEHLVFALHNHAFAYLALTLSRVTPIVLGPYGWAKLTVVPLLWMPIYFFISMRRVYGESRARTFAKFVGISITYGTILFIATTITLLISIMMLV